MRGSGRESEGGRRRGRGGGDGILACDWGGRGWWVVGDIGIER